MKKKIKRAGISIIIIVELLLSILIGVKNGTIDKLTKEMPTLATSQAETEKSAENVKKDSTESKPYEGIEVAGYGEEFEIRREISIDRKYNENDRTTYNVYHVRVKDCRISRQCDFDINRIDYGLANKKDGMDDNNNFISDYFYAAIELELTKDINDNDVDDYYNVFQTSWFIESLKDDGTHPPIKNAGTVGSDAEANQMGKTYFSFEKGETKKLILYCIFTDEEVENDTIALSFHDRTSPYIGPLAIIHEPGGENE